MVFYHKNMIMDYSNFELTTDNNPIEHVTEFKL